MMKQITETFRNDEFRQLIRDDMDLSQLMHHKSREKQRKITDGMTQMMINTVNWQERHSRYEDWNAVRFSRDFQRQICSSDQHSVQRVMQSNGFVIDSHYLPPVGGRAGETKAIFVPKEKIVRAGNWIKQKYLQQTQRIEHQGFSVDWTQTFDFGGGVQIPSRIRIDAAVLQEFCEEKFREDEKLHADWHLAVMLSSSMENEGWMEQNYWVSPLGRLFGRGISSLQYCPKELLRRILPKTCSVLDVNTAALVILYQEHQRLVSSQGSSFPHLEEFIAEKTRIRRNIADSLGVEIDQVKKAFTAIGFGIKRTTSPYPVRNVFGGGIQYEESTLVKNFGSRQTAEQFLKDEFVKEYWNEYSRLGAELTKEVRKQNPAWIEELKRTLEIPKHQILPKKTILFYLFQQSEAEVLKSICRQVGADLVLPKHDAAVILRSYEPQEVSRIEQGILEDTGFLVKLSSEPV